MSEEKREHEMEAVKEREPSTEKQTQEKNWEGQSSEMTEEVMPLLREDEAEEFRSRWQKIQKRWHLKIEARKKIAASIDIVETFNSRISRPHWNRAAMKWAEERGVAMSAGSDAHTIADIGNAWVEVPARPSIHQPHCWPAWRRVSRWEYGLIQCLRSFTKC
jgi:predicted metal-dependent phosphoesterase TrpH